MTADSPAQTTREPVPGRSDRAALGLPAPTILSMCDSLLGEAGRRHHMFTWLRAPGAGAGRMARGRRVLPSRSACRHLPLGRRAARLALPRARPGARARPADARPGGARDRPGGREAVARQEVSRPRARGAGAPPRPSATRAAARQRAGSAPSPPARRRRHGRRSRSSARPSPRGFVQALGMLAGLAFAALLILELYLGVIVVAFDDGRLLLGLAIVLEVLSRALGTVAAERAGRRGLGVRVRDRRRPGRGLGRAAPAPGASTSSRRRSPGCSRCSPARSRCSRSSSAAGHVRREPDRYPERRWIPSPEKRSSSTATRRGARCSRSTCEGCWLRSSPA